MKKLIVILFAAVAFSCGDRSNQASEADDNNLNNDNTEVVEPSDSTSMSDTTSTGDMDRRQDDGDMDRGESGTSGSKTQKDSIR